MKYDEHLTKAIHSLQFALGDLQDANIQASATESLLLIDVIGLVAKAKDRVAAIEAASAQAWAGANGR